MQTIDNTIAHDPNYEVGLLENQTPEAYEEAKLKINNLIWMYMPSSTTLEKAEDIACIIHNFIFHSDELTDPKSMWAEDLLKFMNIELPKEQP